MRGAGGIFRAVGLVALCAVTACQTPPIRYDVAWRVTAVREGGASGLAAPAWRKLAGQRRLGWRVVRRARLAFDLRAPRRAVLELGLGVRRPARVDLQVTMLDVAHRRLLHDEHLDLEPGWSDHRFTIPETGQKPGAFELALTVSNGPLLVGAPQMLVPSRELRPNVLVYSIDCLRADHVGAYGYERPTTPEIDRLARDGVLFERQYSCASWTLASVGCLFTSLRPPCHGGRTVDARLAARLPRLVQSFSAAGYATAGFTANPLLDGGGYDVGFDTFARTEHRGEVGAVSADAKRLTTAVVRWLRAHHDQRFFIYAHSLDLHAPYLAREPFLSRFVAGGVGAASDLDRYDSELAYNDLWLGRMISVLRELGLYDSTLIAVTADHGEEFGEHGIFHHGRSLFEAVVHIPLILKLPGSASAGRRVEAVGDNTDVGPTLTRLAGLAPPAGSQGRDLGSLIAGRSLEPKTLLAEQSGTVDLLYSARDARYKLVARLIPEVKESLYDIASDPLETTNLLATDNPPPAVALRRDLADFLREGQSGYHIVLPVDPSSGPVKVVVRTKGTLREVDLAPLDRPPLGLPERLVLGIAADIDG
jgi:arylsulfatase A-like enzyme